MHRGVTTAGHAVVIAQLLADDLRLISDRSVDHPYERTIFSLFRFSAVPVCHLRWLHLGWLSARSRCLLDLSLNHFDIFLVLGFFPL